MIAGPRRWHVADCLQMLGYGPLASDQDGGRKMRRWLLRPTLAGFSLTALLGGMMLVGWLSPAAVAKGGKKKTVTVHYSTTCSSENLGASTWTGQMTTTLPVRRDVATSFTAIARGTLVVPATVVDKLYADGARWLQLSVSTLNVKSSDALPSTVNVFGGKPAILSKTTIHNGKSVTLKLPAEGTVTVGPWEATVEGADKLTLGASDETIKSEIEDTPVSLAVACSAPATAAELGDVEILP
ncbi:MAG TPA: hypothetical protein VMB51_13590 [Solirubrobacteraceae bacterium]|nr:hypothetical protein [Solirubrobacteraceae bacterium]